MACATGLADMLGRGASRYRGPRRIHPPSAARHTLRGAASVQAGEPLQPERSRVDLRTSVERVSATMQLVPKRSAVSFRQSVAADVPAGVLTDIDWVQIIDASHRS